MLLLCDYTLQYIYTPPILLTSPTPLLHISYTSPLPSYTPPTLLLHLSPADTMTEKDELVQRAKLAEQAER